MKEKNRIALMEFLTILDIKHFDGSAAQEFGTVKKNLKDQIFLLGPLDMLIGTHAKSLGMTLLTNHVKEFERIKELKIENWV